MLKSSHLFFSEFSVYSKMFGRGLCPNAQNYTLNSIYNTCLERIVWKNCLAPSETFRTRISRTLYIVFLAIRNCPDNNWRQVQGGFVPASKKYFPKILLSRWLCHVPSHLSSVLYKAHLSQTCSGTLSTLASSPRFWSDLRDGSTHIRWISSAVFL